MKYVKRSVEVEAVLFDANNTPEGVLYEGYVPATGEFQLAYVDTPVGKLPIKYGDYVVYENGKSYPCTPEAMAQNFVKPEVKEENAGQLVFENEGVKHGELVLNDEGQLLFSGSKKKSAEDFMDYLQKNFIDPYIDQKTVDVEIKKAFALIAEQEIGTKNYFLNEAGRNKCDCCDKKSSVLLLLRNTMKPKRLHICEGCVAKYLLAVWGNRNGN